MITSPSPDEAVAIAAAIERFRAETTPPPAEGEQGIGPWQRAALIEGTGAKATIVDLQGEGGSKWLS